MRAVLEFTPFILIMSGLWFAVVGLMRFIGWCQCRALRKRGIEPSALIQRNLGVNPANALPMVTPLLDVEGNVKFFDDNDRQ